MKKHRYLKINGLFSALFTLLALLLSSTFYLYPFAMLAALISLFFAHFAGEYLWVKLSQVLSTLILGVWSLVILIVLIAG